MRFLRHHILPALPALLARVAGWLPGGAAVLLLADRFYPSAGLFGWLQARGWQYRLRLKGNLTVAVGHGEARTTGELAAGAPVRPVPRIRDRRVSLSTHRDTTHPQHPSGQVMAKTVSYRTG